MADYIRRNTDKRLPIFEYVINMLIFLIQKGVDAERFLYLFIAKRNFSEIKSNLKILGYRS